MYKKLPDDFSLLCDLRTSRPALLSSEILRMVKYSVLCNKYKIYMDTNDLPMGYLAWADVNAETLLRIARAGIFPKYPYEWKEGDIRLFVDGLLSGSRRLSHWRSLVAESLGDAARVAFVKRGRVRYYVKSGTRFLSRPMSSL
jgi:hemolysin-activating ACP:hemolysin acyltransferase